VIDLSIARLTCSRHQPTLACLASIEPTVRARRDAGRVETETVVSDNGSSDGAADAVRARWPWAGLAARLRVAAGGSA